VAGNGLINVKAIVNINGSAKNNTWYSGGFETIDESSLDAYTKLLSAKKDNANDSYTGEFRLIRHKDFTDLSNLSRNQREIGESISASNWKYNSEAEGLVIAIRDAIGSKGADYGKEVLDSLSGSFFANSLKIASVNNRPAMFYSILDASIVEEKDSWTKKEAIYDSLWVKPIFKGVKYGKNNDNPRTFKSFGYGLQAGSNFINEAGYLSGFSMGINLNKLEQGLDEANMTEINAGIFGASYGLNSNIKGNLMISQHTFSSKRRIEIEGNSTHYIQTANADFQAYALSFGAEYEYIIMAAYETDIKPFAGIQNTMVFSDEIKETGGGAIALAVEEDSYLRSELTAGIKLQNSNEKFRWYGKVYMGYILAGASAQYEISFQDELNKTRRDIRSYDEKRLFTGLGLGGVYNVKDDMSAYINTDITASQEHSAFYIGIGVNFKLENGFVVRPRNDDLAEAEKEFLAQVLNQKKQRWIQLRRQEGFQEGNEEAKKALGLTANKKIYLINTGTEMIYFDSKKKARAYDSAMRAADGKSQVRSMRLVRLPEKVVRRDLFDDSSRKRTLVTDAKSIESILPNYAAAVAMYESEEKKEDLRDEVVIMIVKTGEEIRQ
jgi:hypothetical protein